MCGRYLIAQAPEVFAAFYGYPERPNFPPRYNVAPTQPIPVVVSEGGARRFRLVRWGFWPSWLKDPKGFPLVINARAETMTEKATFRGAIRHRRCVMLADGFYEWRRTGTGRAAVRTPFLIRRADGAPMALAGLWDAWMGADGSELDTAAVVTTDANGSMAAIHDRMPAILDPAAVEPWLDARHVGPEAARALCRPCPDGWLAIDPVSARVNDVRNDGPDLIAPLPAPGPRGTGAAADPVSSARDADGQGRLF